MSRECAVELERLYTSTMQVVQSLETLQRPVHHWDDILIFMTVQKLDSQSVKAWELLQGSSKEPSSWTYFREFLMTRMLSLQAFEHSTTTTHSSMNSRSSARSHLSCSSNADHLTSERQCQLCSESHLLYHCDQFKQKTSKQRNDFVVSHRRCFNCLGLHTVAHCRSTRRCQIFGRRHHTLLHQADRDSSRNFNFSNQQQATSSPRETELKSVNHAHQNLEISTEVSLATAQVEVVNSLNERIQVRALLDQGSEVSLASERLVQLLRIPRNYTSISLLGIGDQPPVKSRGLAYLNIRPHFNSQIQVDVRAYILPKLTSQIPAAHTTCTGMPHLKNLELADPHFNETGQIDSLLGADVYGQLLFEDPVKKGPANSPVAQSTKLGWILSGPCDTSNTINQVRSFHCCIDHDLNKALERFWQQEEMEKTSNKSLTAADQYCEDHYVSTLEKSLVDTLFDYLFQHQRNS